MKRSQGARCAAGFAAMAACLMLLSACRGRDLALADLLGTWEFANSLAEDFDKVAAEITVTLNADLTVSVPSLGYDHADRFAFRGETFRVVIHFPVWGTHITLFVLWEGERVEDGLLAGRVFTCSPLAGVDPMDYETHIEMGRFSARRRAD